MDMVRFVPGGSALTVALVELLRVWYQPQRRAFASPGLRLQGEHRVTLAASAGFYRPPIVARMSGWSALCTMSRDVMTPRSSAVFPIGSQAKTSPVGSSP